MLPETDNSIVVFFIAGTVFIFMLVVFLFVYVYLHQHKVNLFQVRLRDQELKKQQELFMALNEGEEKERKRLAEELHDGIGAKLSGLKMSVEYLKTSHEQDQGMLEKIAEGMNETIEELREVSQNLKPSFLSAKGLELALHELVEHYNSKSGCKYQLYIEVKETDLHAHVQLIYRIVSELLNNIRKHAQASLASVQVITADQGIQVIVEDNGKGFDLLVPASNGIGLDNIRNRVDLYKGKLQIDSTTKGTVVIVELPLHETI